MGKFFMSPQEALLKIKAMFAEAQAAPEVAVANFAEYVLASGVKVMVDKLEVGGKVTLLDEAGNEVPAPVGEHTLADGSVIVLDETGTILEIKVPEVKVEIEAPESEVELMKKKVAEMEAQIEELKSYKKEAEVKMSENIAQMNDKFSKAISELTDVVIELTKTPSVAPTQPKQFTKHFESKNDKISRFLSNYAK
jgi:glutamate synthase domain-containing protein 3